MEQPPPACHVSELAFVPISRSLMSCSPSSRRGLATAEIAAALLLPATIVPVTNDRLRTRIRTDDAVVDFQEYFVKRHTEGHAWEITFDGASSAAPAPGVVEAIGNATGVLLTPSNPLVSIAPILAVPGVRDALRVTGDEERRDDEWTNGGAHRGRIPRAAWGGSSRSDRKIAIRAAGRRQPICAQPPAAPQSPESLPKKRLPEPRFMNLPCWSRHYPPINRPSAAAAGR